MKHRCEFVMMDGKVAFYVEFVGTWGAVQDAAEQFAKRLDVDFTYSTEGEE